MARLLSPGLPPSPAASAKGQRALAGFAREPRFVVGRGRRTQGALDRGVRHQDFASMERSVTTPK